MITLEIDTDYDLILDNQNNLKIQNSELLEIAQTIMNRCSLIRGEDKFDNTNGLNASIMLSQDYTLEDKKSEIERVILLDERIKSVDEISYKFDNKSRVGYFSPVVTVTLSSGDTQRIQFNLAV